MPSFDISPNSSFVAFSWGKLDSVVWVLNSSSCGKFVGGGGSSLAKVDAGAKFNGPCSCGKFEAG